MPGPRNDACELRFALSYDDLKMNGMSQVRADGLELARDVHLQLTRLDHARARDQEQRMREADVEAAELQIDATSSATASAASPRPRVDARARP
jgi:hypothetical protein